MEAGRRIHRINLTVGAVTIAALIVMAMASSATAQVPGVPPMPIVSTPTSAPAFVGGPAKPKPIARGFRVPQDPFMAPNGVSNLHVDAYQTDAYGLPGPTGRNLGITSTLFTRLCGSLTFDSQGRVLTICIGFTGPVLVMLDPTTLQTLATYTLPGPETMGGDPFTHISGGGYFYLDNHDRVVVPTNTRHVYVIAESGPTGFSLVSDYDLTGVVPHGVGLLSDLPDWKGHIWFAAENGTVGWIDPRNGSIHVRPLGEQIANSLAVDEKGGVYIVTTRALYRLQAIRGKTKVIWRSKYPNNGVHKPGQLSAGSGTTPTLLGKNEVAITDNADRMHVIVYTRGRKRGGKVICRRGVFAAGTSDDENSLVAAGSNSLIAENNYGYTEQSMDAGQLTAPGIAKIVLKNGRCRTAWTSDERVPSVVSKASLKSGLLYTYTRPPTGDRSQAWYFTAIDLRTGKTVYSRLTGAGTLFNNHYAPVSIGRNGVAYVGVLGGLLRLADSG